MRLISTINRSVGVKAKVYFNSDFEEYIVKFYSDNVYHDNADYFTDDKDDALNTATLEIDRIVEMSFN